MATAPGAAATPAHGGMEIASTMRKSMTFEVDPSPFATSRPKFCGPVRIFWLPFVAGRVTSSSFGLELEKLTSDGGKATPLRRTVDELLKPRPKIWMPLTDCGRAVELMSTDWERIAGSATPSDASTGGVEMLSICSGLMFPRNSGVIEPLPELTANARLRIGSTASAPLKLTWTGAVAPDGVKLAVATAVWPVWTMVTRSNPEGSSREI